MISEAEYTRSYRELVSFYIAPPLKFPKEVDLLYHCVDIVVAKARRTFRAISFFLQCKLIGPTHGIGRGKGFWLVIILGRWRSQLNN